MKKLLLILSLFLYVFNSCSSPSSSENIENRLISKMVYQGESVNFTYRNFDFNFIYDNSERLIRINRGDKVYREFTYSSDLIIEVKYYVFWNGNSQSTLEDILHFDYDSTNRLIKVSTANYEYNFNYTDLNHADYTVNTFSTAGNNNLYLSGTINFDNVTKNILSATQVGYQVNLGQNGNPIPNYPIYKDEFIYDNKKHPCSNIKGYKDLTFFNLLNMNLTIFTDNLGASNNITAVKNYPIDQPNNDTYQVWSYEYGQTFPSKAKKLGSADFKLVFYF